MESIILKSPDVTIYIVSGEGSLGTKTKYTGKRTERALKMRLTKEQCGGDRWARAEIHFANGSQPIIFTN